METIWAASAFPPEHIVLRLRLRPYCCGHEINLCQIQSPFAIGGASDLDDLFTAVLICSQTFEQGQEIIRKPLKALTFSRLWGWLLRWKAKPNMFHVELQKFRGYLHAGSWSPDVHQIIAGIETRTLKAPRVWRLVPFLCAQLGLTESQALNFPLARANAYYAAHLDAENKIDLQGGEREEALVRFLKETEANEGGAVNGKDSWAR